MVGDPTLGKIVGADALVAHTGADLAAALGRDGRLDALLLELVELRGEHHHAALAVLELAALRLAEHHDARGQVGQADGGGGLVDVLAAGAAGAAGLQAGS